MSKFDKSDFKQHTFAPLVQRYVKEIFAYTLDNKKYVLSSVVEVASHIANMLSDLELENKKYIVMSLSRIDLALSGEFIYRTKIFDNEFASGAELSENSSYHTSWLTNKWREFITELGEVVNKSMIKHDSIFIEELKAQAINDFNSCFVRTTKNLLSDYTNESLNGIVILAGDHMFDYKCLSNAKFEKIKEFGFDDVSDTGFDTTEREVAAEEEY